MKHIVDQDHLGINKDALPVEKEHHTQFQFEEINDAFAIKVKDSDFFESLCASFYKTHCSRWICDSSFEKAFRDDLRSQGVPEADMNTGVKALEALKKTYVDDGKKNENAVGYGDMKGLKEVSQDFKNEPISSKETFSGDNKPPFGIEPKHTRPTKTDL